MGLVEISHVQGHTPVTIFHLQDRVNLGNSEELEGLAKEAYSYGIRDLVIDLSKTPSMTSISSSHGALPKAGRGVIFCWL